MDTDTIYTLHLFAGAGGGILGDLLLGHIPVGAVEIEAYPRKVLLARQLDGSIPQFPIWDDVCTFRRDNPDTAGYIERLRGIRDRLCICGGFPCQDISCAGKGAGIDGERSGLWREFARIIGEIRPAYVFVENSPMLLVRGATRVIADLAGMGYVGRNGVLGACDAGAPHARKRSWILANSNIEPAGRLSVRKKKEYAESCFCGEDVADTASVGQSRQGKSWFACDPAEVEDGETDSSFAKRIGHVWGIKSALGRVANGVANRLDRLHAVGNGQCPQVVKLAWEILAQ